MKNVNKYQLKKCIFLTIEEFDEILKTVYPDSEVNISYDFEGMSVDVDDDGVDVNDMYQKLAEYFDVNTVTSIHIDDCDTVGVWIVYKNEEE